MRTIDNLLEVKPFEKYAQTWCKHCGAGDSVILVSSGRYARVSRVLGEGGPFLDEETNFTDEEVIFRCEECGMESGEQDDVVTDNIWIAEENYRQFHNTAEEVKEKEEEEEYYIPIEGLDEDNRQ